MYLIRVSFTVSHGDTRIVSWKRYVLYIKPVIICLYVIEGIIADLCEWITEKQYFLLIMLDLLQIWIKWQSF